MNKLKALIKKILKPFALGRLIYPYVQKTYRSVAIPMRRRLLRRKGWEVLARIDTVLTSLNAPYFLDYGTLLGLIRDGGFIPHDDDIDLTIPPGAARPQEVLKASLAAGFSYVHGFDVAGYFCEFTVRDRTNLTIDLFFPLRDTEDATKMIGYDIFWEPTRTYPNERANTVVATAYAIPTTIKRATFNGIEVSIPDPPEALLACEYGAGWKVPDPNFRPREERRCWELKELAFRMDLDEALAHA